MDLDLNQACNLEYPLGFEDVFDNDLFEWNLDFNQTQHGKNIASSPQQHHKQPTNCENIEESEADETQAAENEVDENGAESPCSNDGGQDSSDVELDGEAANDFDRCLAESIENKLTAGSHLVSMDQAYLLYCEYGRLTGFSIKRYSQKYYPGTFDVRVKEFRCSCDGKTNSKKMIQQRLHSFRKQDMRCGCKAKLRVVCVEKGKWKVTEFHKEHNHELAEKQHSYMLRSSRRMTHAKKSLLEALLAAGIRISTACRFMEKEAGGPQNTGFIRKDAYNHMDKVRRKSKMDNADAEAIMKLCIEKSNREPFFYWNMQKDDEGRLMNFFFRDTRSLIDYEFFGDVLSVDTTYKTNKYDLICAPFVGVNHHMKNCLYGLAFLSDETTSTFEWLFSSFIESMNGKHPQVVFSDQCLALMNAIDSQFTSSSHRLCQWHINQNAPHYFGSLNGNKEFKDLWYHCMSHCETIEEFEDTWTRMVGEYGLCEDRWFANMYKLRKRWSNVFTQHQFCAGLNATSRSESTNHALKDISVASSSLYSFIMNYEKLALDWRRMEGEDDTKSLGVPGLLVEGNPLLKQAAKYFTRAVFLSYEYSAAHTINVNIVQSNPLEVGSSAIEYLVTTSTFPFRSRRVIFETTTSEASCSCCLWEKVGVLCEHIIRIYYHHNMHFIPNKYLLHRLSKDAKKRRGRDVHAGGLSSATQVNNLEKRAFESHVMRNTYELLNEIDMDSDMRSYLLDAHEKMRDELRVMATRSKPNSAVEVEELRTAPCKPTCLDPKMPEKRRFTNTRLSSHWEKKPKKGKKTGGGKNSGVPSGMRSRAPTSVQGSQLNIPNPRNYPSSPSRFDHFGHVNSPSTSANGGDTRQDFLFPMRATTPHFFSTQ